MQTRGPALALDTVAAKMPIATVTGVGTGTTFTLNEYQSGSIVLLDRAGGATYVLPDARPGINYWFHSTANLTSGSYTITATAASSSYAVTGLVQNINSSSTTATTYTAGIDGSKSTQKVVLNARSTGGLIGSYVKVTAVSSGTWHVTGLVVGTATTATPFLA